MRSFSHFASISMRRKMLLSLVMCGVVAGCHAPQTDDSSTSESPARDYPASGDLPDTQDTAVLAAWTAAQTDPDKIYVGLSKITAPALDPNYHSHFLENVALVVKLADQFEALPPDHPPVIDQSEVVQGPASRTTVIWGLLLDMSHMAYDRVEGDVLFRHLEPPPTRPEWHKIWEEDAERLRYWRAQAKSLHDQFPTTAVPPNVLGPAAGEPQ